MKKFVIASLFIVGLLVTPTVVVAQEETHTESVEGVVQELIESQGVANAQELDCSQISEVDLARLGDAVMETYHPGEEHEFMDRMMGGENSDSLELMHINMGSSYLGCYGGRGARYMQGDDMPRGMMGMMGYGEFDGDDRGRGGYFMKFSPEKSNSYFTSKAHLVMGGITWLAFIVFLASGTYYFLSKAGKK